jgi:hypothetical protein
VIFVTVGLLLPFDRLVALTDAFAATHPGLSFMAQIGSGAFVPRHMPFERVMNP